MGAKTPTPPDAHEDDLKPVMLPSGGAFNVYAREVGYFQERVKRYLKDNHFTNIADLATLDQVLILELLIWRWTNWVSQQIDYWGEAVDDSSAGVPRAIKETSAELRQLKASLGIDKVTRDKQKGEESTSVYLENLRVRAREFGVMREQQLQVALELAQELISIVTLHDNCDDLEQREQHCTSEDVIGWIRTTFVPKFQAVDEHFRHKVQKFWVRDQ